MTFTIGQSVHYVKKSYGVHTVVTRRIDSGTNEMQYLLDIEGSRFWAAESKIKEV
jgi:hypothetical protein